MTRRKTPSTRQPRSQLSPPGKRQLLRSHREKGLALLNSRPITSANEQAWETVVQDLLIRAFGSTSHNIEPVTGVGHHCYMGGNETSWEKARAETMKTRLEILDGLIELLDSQANLPPTGSVTSLQPSSGPDQIGKAEQGETGGTMKGLRSFIVHGHDENPKLALKNYLQNTLRWPEPVILAEKPSGGKTIIEKFEDHSQTIDVVFVLLTPDDMGSLVGGLSAARARQNVVFELGYFVGKFGRTSGA